MVSIRSSVSFVIQLQKQPFADVLQNSVLNNFEKFAGKHLCQSFFFKEVAGLRLATLLKARLWHCEFCIILKSSFFYRTPLVITLDLVIKNI